MRLIRWITPLVVAALFVAIAPVRAEAAPSDSPLAAIPVTGTLADGSAFAGTLSITEWPPRADACSARARSWAPPTAPP